jgi:predicted transcriptional regulator
MPSSPRKPTEMELAILRVLWANGPSTVREVAGALRHRGAYTTVLKFLQIMTRKKLVVRDGSSRSHVYRAAHSQERTQRQLVRDLLTRAFDGSAATLVLRALSEARPSAEELQEIRKLIDAHRGGRS